MRPIAQLLLLTLVLAAGISAQPLTWILQGVTFNDTPAGTASGSFSYDPTTGKYSNINITTTTSMTGAGATYTIAAHKNDGESVTLVPASEAQWVEAVDYTGRKALKLVFSDSDNELTLNDFLFAGNVLVSDEADVAETGGLTLSEDSVEGHCADASCSTLLSNDETIRFVIKGGTIASSEPLFQFLFFGN